MHVCTRFFIYITRNIKIFIHTSVIYLPYSMHAYSLFYHFQIRTRVDCITKRIGHLTKTLGYLLANELRTLRPDVATAQGNRAVILALKALALLVRVESASFAEVRD